MPDTDEANGTMSGKITPLAEPDLGSVVRIYTDVGTHEKARAVDFYPGLGFKLICKLP